ncbi:MAG: hypothetical protein ABRQ38_16955 [Candidatus Eremiobacterota bacterium]
MRKKIARTLTADLIIIFLLIFCLSRIQFIMKNSPPLAIAIPVIWFLFGAKFIVRKDLYGDLVKEYLLFRWAVMCIVMGVLSLLYIAGSFIYK